MKSINYPPPSNLIYACPHCNYQDTIFFAGMIPDPCPKHPNATLVKVEPSRQM